MKFEKWLSEHKLDAWVHNYLRFTTLKETLKTGNIQDFAAKFNAELARVNSFYCSILEIHKGRWTSANESLQIALNLDDPRMKERELYTQKEIVEATYTGLMHLQEYSFVNYRAAAHLLLKIKKLDHDPGLIENLNSKLLSVSA